MKKFSHVKKKIYSNFSKIINFSSYIKKKFTCENLKKIHVKKNLYVKKNTREKKKNFFSKFISKKFHI